MRKMFSMVMFLMVVFIALAVTNPDRDHFYNWIEKTYQTDSETNILDALVLKGAEFQANFNVVFDDKVIFTFASTEVYGEKMRFLGVAGNWFALDKKEK